MIDFYLVPSALNSKKLMKMTEKQLDLLFVKGCKTVRTIAEKIQQAANKDEFGRLKAQLPAVCFQGKPKNVNNLERKQDNMQANGLIVLDFDHISDARALYESLVKNKVNDLGIRLAYITPSGEGLKIVCDNRFDADIKTAHRIVADKLGGELAEKLDECCHNIDRISFVPLDPANDVLYFDREFFMNGTLPTPPATSVIPVQQKTRQANTSNHPSANKTSYTLDAVAFVAEHLLDDMGGYNEGCRNNMLFKLAAAVSPLLSKLDELYDVLPLPDLPGSEIDVCLQSAWNAGKDERPSAAVKCLVDDWVEAQAIEADEMESKSQAEQEDAIILPDEVTEVTDEEEEEEQQQAFALEKLNLPDNLPEEINSLLNVVAEFQRKPAFFSVMTMLGVLGGRIMARSLEDTDMPLSLETCIVGPFGSGKGFINILRNVLMERLIDRERKIRAAQELFRNKDAAQELKDTDAKKYERMKKLKDKPTRILTANTSLNKLLHRLVAAGDLPCLLYSTEVDMLGKTGWSNLTVLLRAAYEFEEYGNDSCSEMTQNTYIPHVRLALLTAGTPLAVDRFYGHSLEDGTASRTIFAELEDAGLDELHYNLPSPDEKNKINAMVDRLMAYGRKNQPVVFDLPNLRSALREWLTAFRKEAFYSQSETERNKFSLAKRAASMALRVGTIISAILTNDVEHPVDDDVVKAAAMFTAEYVHLSLCKRFLHTMITDADEEQQKEDNQVSAHRHAVNVYDSLPESFTKQELRTLMQRNQSDVKDNALRQAIFRWTKAGLIQKVDKHYEKIRRA